MFTSVLFGLLALERPAHAEAGELQFGAYGGYLWTDPEENLNDTWIITPRIGLGLVDPLSLEADLVGWAQGRARVVVGDDGIPYRYDAFTPRINLLVYPWPDIKVRPFLVVGGGIIYKKIHRDAEVWEPSPQEGGFGNYKNPDTDALLNAGPGLEARLTPGMALRVDFRWLYNVGTEPHGEIPDQFTDWELTGGFNFYPMAAKRDLDGDGITDAVDECPEDPEDYDRYQDADGCPDPDNDRDRILDINDTCPLAAEDEDGFADADGCPDTDNDGDGLLDEYDRCPDVAEDLEGWQDEDGCPDIDNDGDGIVDLEDSCPNHAEDMDGFDDEDGCPDRDNDGDAILDDVDACVNDPETYNGIDDEDGCPDELPPQVVKFTGVIKGINFEVASDQITVDSYRLLDEAAAVLVEYDMVMLEVQGHTDSDGGDDYNLDLSARRAGAVVRYLVNRGVAPERLSWIGYGEERPLASNDTVEGKAINRRVEFHIVNEAAEDATPQIVAPDGTGSGVPLQ